MDKANDAGINFGGGIQFIGLFWLVLSAFICVHLWLKKH
jgi:hypothetical protein